MKPQVHLNCKLCEERIREKNEKKRRLMKKKVPLVRWGCEECGMLFETRVQWDLHMTNERKKPQLSSKLEEILGDLMEITEEQLIKEISEADIKQMEKLDEEEVGNILK